MHTQELHVREKEETVGTEKKERGREIQELFESCSFCDNTQYKHSLIKSQSHDNHAKSHSVHKPGLMWDKSNGASMIKEERGTLRKWTSMQRRDKQTHTVEHP